MGIAPLNVPCTFLIYSIAEYITERLTSTDRDIAISLGWVQTLLGRAILSLPEDKADMTLKMDAIAAINKVRFIAQASLLMPSLVSTRYANGHHGV